MTPQQIAIQAGLDTFFKHIAGEIEHGGKLDQKPCWKFIKPEILDLVNYYYTMEQQLREGIMLIRNGLQLDRTDLIEKGVNIIEFGNETGTVYND